MPIPAYAQQDFRGLRSERQPAPPPSGEDAAERALTEAARVEPAPAGTPPGSGFDLVRAVRRAAPFVLLLALAGCDGPPASSASSAVEVPTRVINTGPYGPNLYEVHLPDRAITCWSTVGGGLFCLPDSQIRRDR